MYANLIDWRVTSGVILSKSFCVGHSKFISLSSTYSPNKGNLLIVAPTISPQYSPVFDKKSPMQKLALSLMYSILSKFVSISFLFSVILSLYVASSFSRFYILSSLSLTFWRSYSTRVFIFASRLFDYLYYFFKLSKLLSISPY